jgi:hypothetical protein
MKSLLTISFLLFTFKTHAAVVHSAKLDAGGQNILVEVSYGGGCKKHDFSLDLGGCFETFPVRCEAKLVDNTTGDFCEAIVPATAVFPLKQYGLTDKYFSRGSLTIYGDLDWQTKKPSSATVHLP